ncbi:hypothetical protein AB0J52_07865 [Spirillospora sp. NPDC049652]
MKEHARPGLLRRPVRPVPAAGARHGLSRALAAAAPLVALTVWAPAARADFGDMESKHWQCADPKHYDQDKDKQLEIQNWNCLVYDEKGPPGYIKPEIPLEWCKRLTPSLTVMGRLGKPFWAYEGCRIESGKYTLTGPNRINRSDPWPKQETVGYHFTSQTSLKPQGHPVHCLRGVYTLRNEMTVRVIHHTFDRNIITKYGTVSFDHTEKITIKGCP